MRFSLWKYDILNHVNVSLGFFLSLLQPLKWELKQKPGMSPPRGGFEPDDPNQQIVAEDIFDEYGGEALCPYMNVTALVFLIFIKDVNFSMLILLIEKSCNSKKLILACVYVW